MVRKQNKRNTPTPASAPREGGAGLLPVEAERVRELITGRHSKSALQLARDIYKRCATAESEALLLEAYKARIEDLLKLGMTVEAKALLGIVRERFPAGIPQLVELDREFHALEGRLEEVVAPLGDANLPAADRERIETFIRQRIHDLPTLAAVTSLPPEHPLRVAASALAAAFTAVTQGPVDDALLALPEVSHRSPLAPWKALIRAIASYYRREEDACIKWLKAIADDSVPARLVLPFAAIMGQGTDGKFSLAGQKLIAAAGDHGAALRSALAAMEEALQAKKHRQILDAARTTMAAAGSCDAKTREHLRQHIAVRSLMLNIQPTAINAAMGGGPRMGAYYFRLLARILEEGRSAGSYAEAVMVWEYFRSEAIKENWFAAGGLEDGVLSLHMAQITENIPPEIIKEMRDRESFYRKPGKQEQSEDIPSAGVLYLRACKADPSSEAFHLWLTWAKKHGPWQVSDNVAEHWRKAHPKDIQPLLHLMESAEQRSAFKKSLKYLAEAEELDRLNPEVHRARLRLLLSAAIRHLSQRKMHLAQGEMEQLATVLEVRAGEVAALAATLRWCCAAVDRNKAAQRELETELDQSIGSVAAHLLTAALLQAANLGSTVSAPPLKISKTPPAELLAGAVKACVLAAWAGLPLSLSQGWSLPLMEALHQPNCSADTAQMLLLGETALDSFLTELSYAISAVGLASGQANARFLFLRARSLPQWAFLRREGCFTAALELARRERDMELAGKILDQLTGGKTGARARRGYNLGMPDDVEIADRPVSPELLSQILVDEQDQKQFPIYNRYREPRYAEALGTSACDCPRCQARRSGQLDDSDLLDEDDLDDEDAFDGEAEFDDEGEFDDEADSDGKRGRFSSPAWRRIERILNMLAPGAAKAAKKAIQAGEDPKVVVDRIMSKAFSKPISPAPTRIGKTAKLPPPGQGRLF